MKKTLLVFVALALAVAMAFAYNGTNITTATTTTVKSGPGYLSHIVVNGGTMGAITIYDSTTAAGTVIATIASPLAGQHYVYDRGCALGITVVTAAATNITVAWQ